MRPLWIARVSANARCAVGYLRALIVLTARVGYGAANTFLLGFGATRGAAHPRTGHRTRGFLLYSMDYTTHVGGTVGAMKFGDGLAASAVLGVFVTSTRGENSGGDTLHVFKLPQRLDVCSHDMAPLYTILGESLTPQATFGFGWTGVVSLAFAEGDCSPPLLLVTDPGLEVVHIVDVVSKRYHGLVGPAGSTPAPRSVAAAPGLVAVLCWHQKHGGAFLRLFARTGSGWEPVRTVATRVVGEGPSHRVFGLRFSADAGHLAYVDAERNEVVVLSVVSGEVSNRLKCLAKEGVTGGPTGVEYAPGGGWIVSPFLITNTGHGFQYLDPEGRGTPMPFDTDLRVCSETALVPGWCLLVRGMYACGVMVKVYSSPDAIAMSAMSAARVAWMTVAVRARDCREAAVRHAREKPEQVTIVPLLRGGTGPPSTPALQCRT